MQYCINLFLNLELKLIKERDVNSPYGTTVLRAERYGSSNYNLWLAVNTLNCVTVSYSEEYGSNKARDATRKPKQNDECRQ